MLTEKFSHDCCRSLTRTVMDFISCTLFGCFHFIWWPNLSSSLRLCLIKQLVLT
uniref:Uncharacterized protein n=1 Tax=Rhizophora mucronata TaxID=61149 RepID=A0A2P2K783_RHIMU